jgi:hypothetical protein
MSARLELTYQSAFNQQLFTDLSSPEKDATIKQFRHIVGPIVILSSPLSTTALGQLLGVNKPDIDNTGYASFCFIQNLQSDVFISLSATSQWTLSSNKGTHSGLTKKKTHRQLAVSAWQSLMIIYTQIFATCNLQPPLEQLLTVSKSASVYLRKSNTHVFTGLITRVKHKVVLILLSISIAFYLSTFSTSSKH